MAHVAAQTKHIRLGTGVVSLPYHNPLWVAERLAMLDHLTCGRVMLGPGALATDAAMLGIHPSEQRDALKVDTAVLMHLLTSVKPISIKPNATSWSMRSCSWISTKIRTPKCSRQRLSHPLGRGWPASTGSG